MRNDRHLAINLRRKGKSYNEIRKELGIPKSTLNSWFQGLRWSQFVKKNLSEKALRLSTKRMRKIAKANKERWLKWRKQYRDEAVKEFPQLKSNPLFTAGLMLYWGEGDGNLKNDTRLSNIDPRMITLFNKFLLNICKVSKDDIFLSLTIYPDLSDNKCKIFWSNKTGISQNQFNKTQIIYGKHPTKRLENGICTIRVRRSRGLKEKIVIWINLLFSGLVNAH